MDNHDLTIGVVLIVCLLLSILYAWFLEQIHDIYSPKQTYLAVVVGDGAIVDTLFILERQLGIPITAWLVFFVMAAWGIPIILWQLWQNGQRTKQTNGG